MAASFVNSIRSRRRDPDARLGIGLRVSHLLNTVDLQPAGLPPASILIVRRLADPLPRRLPPDPWAVGPAMAWARAAQSDLTNIYLRAARPAYEPVPLHAVAVLFADQGELLSCLARDLLRGAARSLWWWRVILRSLPTTDVNALFVSWQREARHIPAVLARLAASGDARWILNAFSPHQAWTLLEDVTCAFGFTLANAAPEPQSDSISPGTATVSQRWADRAMVVEPLQKDSPAPPPPWRGVLPENLVPADLALEQMALLAVALVLQRTPQFARSRQFKQAFAVWHETVRRPRRFSEATQDLPQPTGPSLDDRADKLAAREMEHQAARAKETISAESMPTSDFILSPGVMLGQALGDDTSVSRVPGIAAPDTQAPDKFVGINLPAELARTDVAAGFESTSNVKLHSNGGDATPLNESILFAQQQIATPEPQPTEKDLLTEPPSSALSAKTHLEVGEPLQTDLGGVLFLINALKALRLPQSLEEECGCELGLGSWELLELLARCLLGPRATQFAFDPVWRLLAVLDGRAPETVAGSNFAAADCYRIPKAWLAAALPGDELDRIAVRWRANHLELWSTLGFPLLFRRFDKLPSSAAILYEIAAITTNAHPVSFDAVSNSGNKTCRPLGAHPSAPMQRFLSFLLPYFFWRVALGLGLREANHATLARSLLLHRGEIWTTSSHIDMVLDLNRASGRIRLSGLDADPGWVPELGRVVKFHFRKVSAS